MVFVNYDGRLGNNLFQLAAGLSLALKNNTEVLAPQAAFYKFINFTPKIYTPKDSAIEYKERGFHYSEIEYTNNISLMGYFQSEKYFKDNKDKVLDLLYLKDSYLQQIKEKYKQILEYETISLHVRRTDYLHLSNAHPVLPVSYYKSALDILNPKDKKILIFSDDLNWCRQIFQGNKFTYVDNNIDILDLFLMSLCNHNIIANSSFSWWGATFNKNDAKKVIAPKNWFGSYYKDYNTKDLYSDGWIVI